MRQQICESVDLAYAKMSSSPFQDGLEDYFWDILLGEGERPDPGFDYSRAVRYTVDSVGRFDHESAPQFDC